jgi:saccharopine dehydrogenase-like NADP-dependent oxidoreductase
LNFVSVYFDFIIFYLSYNPISNRGYTNLLALKNTLVIGAGKSSQVLIEYLIDLCQSENWRLKVVAKEHPENKHERSSTVQFVACDVFNDERLDSWISNADLVISMLPARMHLEIAQKCLLHKKDFLSASYVSAEMKSMHEQAKSKGLLFLNECGLDPGLDHMSAMKIIDDIKSKGAVVTGFESFAGGLIAPDFDDNPWSYKLTWNPRNVVLAGQGGVAKFKQKNTYKYIPYQQLFRRTERINIEGHGKFEGYANRDSLKYESLYNLKGVATLFRGTLRKEGFCKAWDKLILLGVTDDSYTLDLDDEMTYRDFTNLFLNYHPSNSVEVKFQKTLGIAQDDFDIIDKMEFLGLFSDEKIGIKNATPAQVLQTLLEDKWKLGEQDRDMIVMWHKFNYSIKGKQEMIYSSLVIEGETQTKTAMAKTVGLPLGIVAKLILNGSIKSKGVLIPTEKEIYLPVLSELSNCYGIKFEEHTIQ